MLPDPAPALSILPPVEGSVSDPVAVPLVLLLPAVPTLLLDGVLWLLEVAYRPSEEVGCRRS
jgi:hypothetical protein